jgi:hypothetical protein
MNSEKVQGKINNLSNYLQYCESLKQILETYPDNNLPLREKHIKELTGVKNNLEVVDLYIDFFDEMNGIVSKFESENIEIEKKINKLMVSH